MSGVTPKHRPGDLKICDFGSVRPAHPKKPPLKLPPWTAIQGGIGVGFNVAPKLTAVVTHITHSAEETPLLEMQRILQNTLPAIRGGFPLWLIWAYEVDSRLKKYAPNEAETWCKNLTLIRAAFEFFQGPLNDGLVDYSIEKLANRESLQMEIDLFLHHLSSIKTTLLAKHSSLQSVEFRELLILLEGAKVAMGSVMTFPPLPSQDPKAVSIQFSSLIEFLSHFEGFAKTKAFPRFRVLFPGHLRELTLSKEAAIFQGLCTLINIVNTGFALCAKRLAGIPTVLNHASESLNRVYIANGENHRIFHATRASIQEFKIYHLIWKCIIENTWSPMRQARWLTVKRQINRGLADVREFEKQSLIGPAVLGALSDQELALFVKQLVDIFGFIKEKADAYLLEIDGFNKKCELTTLFHQSIIIPLFQEVVPELLVFDLKKSLLNMEGYLQELHALRKQVLIGLRARFQTLPQEFLKKNKDKLITYIREVHVRASLPILWSFELFFHLSNLKLCQERYTFSEETFLGEDVTGFQNILSPLVDHLALAGLEKVVDLAILDLNPKAPYVPPPQPQAAALPKAVSHQAAKPSPAKVDMPKAPPKAKKAPIAVAAGAAAAGAGAAAQNPEPKGDSALDEGIMRVRATSNDRKAVLKVLTDAGFKFCGFGGKHPHYQRDTEKPVPVPHHPKKKTLSDGVVHQLEKAAAGVFKQMHASAAKDQKRRD